MLVEMDQQFSSSLNIFIVFALVYIYKHDKKFFWFLIFVVQTPEWMDFWKHQDDNQVKVQYQEKHVSLNLNLRSRSLEKDNTKENNNYLTKSA